VEELSLSNRITLAGIFAKNKNTGNFFNKAIQSICKMSLSQMLDTEGE
jgi:hypothetical protein